MPPLIASTLPAQPDLSELWRQLSHPQSPELYVDRSGTRVMNPALGILTVDKTPIVVLEQYEAMYAALVGAKDNQPPFIADNLPKVLFYAGHPGIGWSPLALS
jgi:hypothetical protein